MVNKNFKAKQLEELLMWFEIIIIIHAGTGTYLLTNR